MDPHRLACVAAATAIVLAACGSTSTSEGSSDDDFTTLALSERVDAVGDAVDVWWGAMSIAAAHAAAETALNLVVGPNGLGYGDRDGDGVVNGASAVGLLPGIDGTPSGLAESLRANDCVTRDVLGGPWIQPSAEWAAMLTAIDQWRPTNNTMPTLPSHPMRVVGWATFTLDSDSLKDAHEYASHADLHVTITKRALEC